eukprot:354407_1
MDNALVVSVDTRLTEGLDPEGTVQSIALYSSNGKFVDIKAPIARFPLFENKKGMNLLDGKFHSLEFVYSPGNTTGGGFIELFLNKINMQPRFNFPDAFNGHVLSSIFSGETVFHGITTSLTDITT